MKKLSTSDDPIDIATYLYVWGYPLITNLRSIDFSTDPQHYSESEAYGPWNVFHYRTKLADANFTQFVAPHVDTLYSYVYYDLTNNPLVIKIPRESHVISLYSLLMRIPTIIIILELEQLDKKVAHTCLQAHIGTELLLLV